MSLINEALKKAQRQRAPDAAAGAYDPAVSADLSSGPIARRRRPMPAQTLLLIVAGAAVLVVFSAVGTVYLMNRSPEPKSVPVTILPPPPVEAAPDAVAVPANIAPATAAPSPELSPPAVVALPPSTAVLAVPPAEPTSIPPVVPAPALPDPKIQTYVDAIHVAGIRSSGADSKVLMNDRVYRVGDTVDVELGLKLAKVASDSLTFIDARNVSYRKNF
jgi:hypothetical protein